MGNRILITAEAEGIVVRGLETKLKGLGMDVVFSPLISNMSPISYG